MAQLLEPFTGADADLAAQRLLDKFGSLGNLVFASPEALAAVSHADRPAAEMIFAARELVEAGLGEIVRSTPVKPDNLALRQYIAMKLRAKPWEELYAVFSNEDNRYIADETIARGGNTTLQVPLRPLFQRAFDLGARGLILAHNHPSNSVGPSREDIASTRQIERVARALDIQLIDHFIVAGDQTFSMRQAGLI